MSTRLLAFALLAFAALAFPATLTPAVAHACPVCFDANEENRAAFVLTTVLLSVLPLLMVGAIALWIRDATRDP